MRSTLLAPALLLAALATGCNSGNPVASSPTEPGPGPAVQFSVSVTANPPEVIAGTTEPTTLTVTVRRQDNQQSPADGTQVAVTVDQGSLGVANAEAPVRVLNLALAAGQARVSLFPGAQPGQATVLAQVGQSIGRLTVPFLETRPNTFFLTGVSPNEGTDLGGDLVSVRGAGFREPLRVSFGGVQARVVDVPSSAQIVVETPVPAQPVDIGTVRPVDVAVTNALTDAVPVTDTLVGGFTYRGGAEPPPPTPVFLTSVQPNTGPPEGGTTVALSGGGFSSPLRVTIGGKTAVVQSVSASRILARTPSSAAPVPAGSTLLADVTVVVALGSADEQTAMLPGGFTYDGGAAPDPVVVSALSPGQGPAAGGTLVTVTGSGFVSPVAVVLGGVRQGSEQVISATEIRFTTARVTVAACPAGGVQPAMGLTVTNLGSGISGTAPLVFNFQVPLPRVRRVSPTVGGQLGNTVVTIEGEGFEAPVRVAFAEGAQQFAGVVQGTVTSGQVRASSPAVPDSLFPEADCITIDNRPGKRYLPVTVDVVIENQGSGCSDTFPNAFTYNPTFPECRPTTPAP
ncbi:MAG TPA: IPT/TIG domain-containing protein [Thermoanaerobaculia bacterium]|nr:IPT/TIG domain-containing protein [Thermoanaerobaculia bacterium]